MKDGRVQTGQSAIRLGPLAGSLGFLLRLAQLESFKDFFAYFDGHDIRPGEISVLLLIAENPGIRQGAVARRLTIKRAHMTKMVQAFEASGLVEKRVPEDDKRGVELRLTPAGRAYLDKVRPIFAAHELAQPSTLSAEETETLRRLLLKYLDIFLEFLQTLPLSP